MARADETLDPGYLQALEVLLFEAAVDTLIPPAVLKTRAEITFFADFLRSCDIGPPWVESTGSIILLVLFDFLFFFADEKLALVSCVCLTS